MREYELELAVDRDAAAAIVANVDKQSIVTKFIQYIGYTNETAHTMIAELMTHPVVLNAEKREIRAFFVAPCSDSPNMTLKEYDRQLDRRQHAAKKQGVKISDEDKTTHIIGCAEDFRLFKEEWFTKWEATSDRTWTVKRGGYKLAAALRGTRETSALYSAPITLTRAEYDEFWSTPAPSRQRTHNLNPAEQMK